jgi:hypothetical protein
VGGGKVSKKRTKQAGGDADTSAASAAQKVKLRKDQKEKLRAKKKGFKGLPLSCTLNPEPQTLNPKP